MSDIVVFGSFVVDLMARSAHIPVPGETIKSSLFRMGAGGKGSNQAVACKLSGGDVSVVTKVGRDAFAQVLYDQYEKIGLSAEHVFVSSQAQTGNALILVDEGTSQNAITVTPGACETFTRDDVEQIKPLLASAKILLAQLEVNRTPTMVADYAKGRARGRAESRADSCCQQRISLQGGCDHPQRGGSLRPQRHSH
ncbi:MAG: PfkB family carbohydrate kinase [[Clostridium] leptum]